MERDAKVEVEQVTRAAEHEEHHAKGSVNHVFMMITSFWDTTNCCPPFSFSFKV